MKYVPKQQDSSTKSPFQRLSPGDDYKNYYSDVHDATFSANKFGLKDFIWNGKVKNVSPVDIPFANIDYKYDAIPIEQYLKSSVPIINNEPIINPITNQVLEVPIISESPVKLLPKPKPTIWERINTYVNQFSM